MINGIKLPYDFKTDLKRKRLERLIKNATGHLIDLWLTASKDRPDGKLTGWDSIDIATAANWPVSEPVKTLIDALFECNLIDHDGDQYFLPDWINQQNHIAGTSKRKIKATINALIKHHGRVQGLKIAIIERDIDVAKHGYEVPHGFKTHILKMRDKKNKDEIGKIPIVYADSKNPAGKDDEASNEIAGNNQASSEDSKVSTTGIFDELNDGKMDFYQILTNRYANSNEDSTDQQTNQQKKSDKKRKSKNSLVRKIAGK